MSSNGDWGVLAAANDEFAEAWDSLRPVPEPGDNEVLDNFITNKRITHASLVRVGTRLSDSHILAFAYDSGIKYRDIITGRRWSLTGSTWPHMKVVPSQGENHSTVIVCEGETDGARLTELYDADVAIMPAGARYFPASYAEQLAEYDLVLVGLDNDEAGELGSATIIESVSHSMRFAPGGEDWCDTADEDAPELPDELDREEPAILVNARDMMDLEEPAIASWYENALLPVGGLMIVHGWAKSFKTFMALDLMSQLAQGEPWANFEPTEEPTRTAVIQYELTWPYYRQRVAQLQSHARKGDLFNENYHTWSPLTRPRLLAGDTEQEDLVIRELLANDINILLIDPIRRATGAADLNAENEVRVMLGFFQRLNDHGITVVATHHDTKQASRSRGGNPLGMTGSGAWAGDPDSIVSIELPFGDDARHSSRRNMHFTLRNAPPVPGRGFEIDHDTGRISYMSGVFAEYEEEVDDVDPTAPAI